MVSAENHAQDMVAPLVANVCITHHATLNTTACVKQCAMSLPAMSLGDWFSVIRKGGIGGGELVYTQVYQKGESSRLSLSLVVTVG